MHTQHHSYCTSRIWVYLQHKGTGCDLCVNTLLASFQRYTLIVIHFLLCMQTGVKKPQQAVSLSGLFGNNSIQQHGPNFSPKITFIMLLVFCIRKTEFW